MSRTFHEQRENSRSVEAQIEAHIQAYLASGKTIQVIEPGVRTTPPQLSFWKLQRDLIAQEYARESITQQDMGADR